MVLKASAAPRMLEENSSEPLFFVQIILICQQRLQRQFLLKHRIRNTHARRKILLH
jgi:hypothetical protein